MVGECIIEYIMKWNVIWGHECVSHDCIHISMRASVIESLGQDHEITNINNASWWKACVCVCVCVCG